MKNTAKIKNLVVIFVLFLTAFSFAFRVSAISPNEVDPLKDFIASIDAYEGFIVSINPDKTEFLLSVSCTKIDKWSSICAEANPSTWQLWTRFLNLFRDPTHIKVLVSDATQYKSYDTHIPANFAGIKLDTFVGVKGDLSGHGLLGFGGREISANEIIIPQMQSWSGKLNSIENNKILDLKSESGFDIKTYITKNTSIVDKDDNEVSLNNLSLNDDILSVWGRRYEIEWGEDEQGNIVKVIEKVELVAEKIILVGKATGEGEQIKTILGKPEKIDLGGGVSVPNIIGELFCKEGLTRIEVKEGTGSDLTQKFYCTNCGNGICKSPEAEYNCSDCTKLAEGLRVGDNFDYTISIDRNSVNLNSQTFTGAILINGKRSLGAIKFIVTNNTKIYRTASKDESLNIPKEYFSFSDLPAIVTGPHMGPLQIRVKGKVLSSTPGSNFTNVQVEELIQYIQ